MAEYIERKYNCQVTRELRFPGCTFDVVGFNPATEEFYVVETKLGHKPADVGHAYGQVLAYEAVIAQKGHEFIARVFNELKGRLPEWWETTSRFANEETVRVHRYVALTDRACRNYQLINGMRGKLTNPVGVIRYDGKCRDFLRINGRKDKDVCESEPVTIDIMKHYGREDFFNELSRRLQKLHENLTRSNRPPAKPRFIQFKFKRSRFHLEVHQLDWLTCLSCH